jgi:hypothetical protein
MCIIQDGQGTQPLEFSVMFTCFCLMDEEKEEKRKERKTTPCPSSIDFL